MGKQTVKLLTKSIFKSDFIPTAFAFNIRKKNGWIFITFVIPPKAVG